MHTSIYVNDFGPIQEANIDLDKKFQFYVGPQASGKSTLCRIAYFCKKIRDYYVHYLLNRNAMENAYINVVKGNLKKYLRRNFIGCFGTTKHMQPFIINYEFGNHCLTIDVAQGIRQIATTLDQIPRLLNTCSRVHARIVATKAVPNLMATSRVTKLKARLLAMHGTLEVRTRKFTEQDSRLL